MQAATSANSRHQTGCITSQIPQQERTRAASCKHRRDDCSGETLSTSFHDVKLMTFPSMPPPSGVLFAVMTDLFGWDVRLFMTLNWLNAFATPLPGSGARRRPGMTLILLVFERLRLGQP